jgi:hypothetical protein
MIKFILQTENLKYFGLIAVIEIISFKTQVWHEDDYWSWNILPTT